MIIGYVRISNSKDKDGKSRDISIDRQWDQICDYCAHYNLGEPIKIMDKDLSGGDETRPGWRDLLAACETGEVMAVVAYDQDRLFRDALQGALFKSLCRRRGVRLHFVNGGEVDFNTKGGRLQFAVKALFDEEFREDIKDKTTAALAHKKANGEKTGGYVPYGYDIKMDNTQFPPVQMLVENDYEQSVIQFMLQLRQAGIGYFSIGKQLEVREVKTKLGRSKWPPSTVSRVLKRLG